MVTPSQHAQATLIRKTEADRALISVVHCPDGTRGQSDIQILACTFILSILGVEGTSSGPASALGTGDTTVKRNNTFHGLSI